ncbi:SusC/RagA family TonB-linked outer membrane protein [Sinomicrobium pectinilyticum]|uniref:SusC/RagA family TonB-linked outer membrane protein n=1 Tax=Sinomicrobium pectinilyticum TaxID=1084421 RepID=A0A3N0EIS4_SINP1|nr:SusC/RagA family TonB-linked outer membrane protein [Sinomicrobium pectinilyticum]RNL87788.1 SusC/RagA family TonB-linked outer membrane protein [Sinomicrobium pectinilyticum]
MKNNWVKACITMTVRSLILGIWIYSAMVFASKGSGQSIHKVYISVDLKEVTVAASLTEIEHKTDFTFFYGQELVNEIRQKVTVNADNQSVADILEQITKATGLTFRQINGTIAVKKEDPPAAKGPPGKEASGEEQQREVNGTITDANGNPVAGVNIIIKGTNRGTISDPDGSYTIMVTDTDVLTFSFIGYKTVEKTVDGQASIDITLQEDITALKEVEVNAGYYKVKERNRTGSISRITSEDIQDIPFTNPLEALVGRVPGVTVSASGTPGTFLKVRVRGENSLRSIDGESVPGAPIGFAADGGIPLYVIDGVPMNSTFINSQVYSGGLDPLANLNPENIASIEVLKDADATSIYGSRGANGVILITTKRGPEQKATDFQFSLYKGIGKTTTHVDLLNTGEYLQMRHEALENDGIDLEAQHPFIKAIVYPDLTFWDQERYKDWQKELLNGTSEITDLQANFSGGSGNTTYRFGGSFHREDLANQGDSYFARGEGHFAISHRSTDNRFSTGMTVNYGFNKQDLQGGGLTNTLWLPPNAPPLYDENGQLNWAVHPETGQATWNNPLAALTAIKTSDNRNLVANANLGYRLLSQLEFKLNLGYTENKGKENSQSPMTALPPDQRYNPETGQGTRPSSRFGYTRRQGINIEPQVEYQVKTGQHRFDVLIGGAYQENENETLFIQGSEYTTDTFLGSLQAAGLVTTQVDNRGEYHYIAAFGRLGYRFKERYILNLTGRRDGSSRFGPGKRFGNFGAIGGAWIFSDEPGLRQKFPALSFGKLRGSYGTTGNDNIGDYLFFDLYGLFNRNYENNMSLTPRQLFNPDLNWEKTRKLEAALELGFFDNRIMLETSWYRNRSSNQLIFRPLPFTSGFSGVVDNFSDAEVQNSGWEFMVRGEPVRRPDFGWSVSFNLSVNRNKLVAFPGIEDSPYAKIYQVGAPLSILRLYTSLGVDPETGVHQLQDIDENGIINDEDKQFSNALQPDFMGGLSQRLRYKGLELDMLFQYSRQTGRYFPPNMPGLRSNQPKIVLKRWQQPGDITDIQRYSAQALTGSYVQVQQSNADIEDQSFIRLRTLGLSYRFPQPLIKRIGVKQLRLFVRGQNLLLFSKARVPDPETGYGTPPLRMFTTGLELTL